MRAIKLLTLNTHSLVEENYNDKFDEFVNAISCEQPDIIALQEVNQTCCKAVVSESELEGFSLCDKKTVIREDNHVYNVVKKLRERGINYYWTWVGIKVGYGKYDEGMALMSLSPIIETDVLLVSKINDYQNWKTRKIIGIRTVENPNEWFYTVHYGWWNDEEEPFQNQWQNTDIYMKKHNSVWLMGDFNSPAEIRDEGYDMIAAGNWNDSYNMAEKKDSGITVGKVIDGWKEKIESTNGMRIDQIWCSQEPVVKSSEVIFDGKNYEVVSDHYGIIVEYERN